LYTEKQLTVIQEVVRLHKGQQFRFKIHFLVLLK